MKKVESILLHGCAYSILISLFFFVFAEISRFTDARMGLLQFSLIVLFGQIISLAGYILKYAPWHVFLRVAVHYLALFVAFSVIFILNGNITGGGAILSAAVIFTFFYALVFLLTFVIRKSLNAVEKKLPQKNAKDNKEKTEKYSPRFK